MVLTLVVDDEEKPGPGSGPGDNGNAQDKTNATNGEGNIPDPKGQLKTPAELAAELRAGATYPDFPIDVIGALRGRGCAVAEVPFGEGEGVLIRKERGVAAVLLNSRQPEAVRRWAAAGFLYLALATPDPSARDMDIAYYSLAKTSEVEAFAAELLLPAADVRKVWAREMKAGAAADKAVKIIAGVFDVPENRARARAVELDLITE